MKAETSIICTMDPVVRHILQFNLDFGPDAPQTQLLWKLHFLSPSFLYIRSWQGLADPVCKSPRLLCLSQETNKIDLRIKITFPFFQRATSICVTGCGYSDNLN